MGGFEAFTLLIVTSIVGFVTSLWGGFVLTKLWGWFVSPLFGLPTPSLVAAVGLWYVVAFLTQPAKSPYDPEDARRSGWVKLRGGVTTVFLRGLMFLLFGWIWSLLI